MPLLDDVAHIVRSLRVWSPAGIVKVTAVTDANGLRRIEELFFNRRHFSEEVTLPLRALGRLASSFPLCVLRTEEVALRLYWLWGCRRR